MTKKNGSTTQKPRRGRKLKYGELDRSTHNISLSEKAWKGLGNLTKKFKLRFRSELLEKIGTNEFVLSDTNLDGSEFAFEFCPDTPMAIQLVSFYRKKNPLLRSVTASICRYIDQLDLCEEDSYERTKLMCRTLLKTARVIELMKQLKPDYSPKSLPGLVVWISYQILFNSKNNGKQKNNLEKNLKNKHFEKIKMDEGLWKIGYSISRLKWEYPKSFRLLNCRFRHKKDYPLVVEYLNAHGQKNFNGEAYSRSTVLKESLSARLQLRNIFHKIEKEEITEDYLELEERDSVINNIGGYPPKIKRYYELASIKKVSTEDHIEICNILQEASCNLHLDFWINEVDHAIGHDLGLIKEWLDFENHGDEILKLDENKDGIISPLSYDNSYDEFEKDELERLEKKVKIEIDNLHSDLRKRYILIRIDDFEELIFNMIGEVGNIDICNWFKRVYNYELKSLERYNSLQKN